MAWFGRANVLWKVLREREGGRFLAGVLEAPDHEAAQAAEAARHDELRASYGWSLEPVDQTETRPLRVRAGPFELDGGRMAAFTHSGERWRAALPPSVCLFDQLLDHLEQNAPPATPRPAKMDQGQAVAKLAFRWGSYFALIGDPGKPQSPAAGTRCGYWNDSEQARMSIEISANLERIYHLISTDKARWHRLVVASQLLPGLPAAAVETYPEVLMMRLRKGRVEAYRDFSRKLRSVTGTQALSTEKLKGLVAAEDKPELWDAFEVNPIRRICNTFAFTTWRVPLEDYHGVHPGAPKLSDEVVLTLDYNRFTPSDHAEIESVMAQAGAGFMRLMSVLEPLTPNQVRERAAFPTVSDEAGRKWSITERTRAAIL
jgi:hypothetical protein